MAFSAFNLAEDVFYKASEGDGGVTSNISLRLTGTSVQELAENLKNHLIEAAHEGDFTQILSSNRHFSMCVAEHFLTF